MNWLVIQTYMQQSAFYTVVKPSSGKGVKSWASFGMGDIAG